MNLIATNDIQLMPKMELHAHLSGSLSDATLAKMISKSNWSEQEKLEQINKLKLDGKRTLSESFDIFKIIHKLTSTLEAVREMTESTIREFYCDGVVYLELRTTPKAVEGAYSKIEYINAVSQTIIDVMDELPITVRLLLSLDRGRDLADAWDTVRLLKQFKHKEPLKSIICGVDVSGDPTKGNLIDFIDILKEVRSLDLKLAVHLLEVNSDIAKEEAYEILERNLVDRIGHGTFLHPNAGGALATYQIAKRNKIPSELCLTSNLKCGTVAQISSHHVSHMIADGLPFTICTDDKGVFATSLSAELQLFVDNFAELATISDIFNSAVDMAFMSDNLKNEFKAIGKCYYK